MDIVREIETRYKMPRTALALLAIVFGIIIILFRDLLAILVGLLLIFWGVYEGYKLATTRATSRSTTTSAA